MGAGSVILVPDGVPDFVPADFVVPTSLEGDGFRLTPLGPHHNAEDYAAWTSSVDHIRATPGFVGWSWPKELTAAENLDDLRGHDEDFKQRRGFTYTVLSPAGEVIGCVYIYPTKRPGCDVTVRSWVRGDHADLDAPLYHAVGAWLSEQWPFTAVDYAPRDHREGATRPAS